MPALPLHDFLAARGAAFTDLRGEETVSSFGSADAEYAALTRAAVLLDLSSRGRLCVLGSDREKFLHGQVTNDIQRLKTGQGCYAALVNGRGKIQSDLFVWKLAEELLLDLEPGLAATVLQRLEKYVIAEDVQLVDASPHYGLLTIQGPKAWDALVKSSLAAGPQPAAFHWAALPQPEGELYLANNPRFGTTGFDLFIPTAALERIAVVLEAVCAQLGGGWAGNDAAEVARIENAIPRFGFDMDESNLTPEAGIQDRAISYAKGCYIGQEVIARIRTYGQVAKALRLLRLDDGPLPPRGEKLFHAGKEIGYITSSATSPKHGAVVALAYVRKEANAVGTELHAGTDPARRVTIIGQLPS